MNKEIYDEMTKLIDTSANVYVSSIDKEGYPTTRCMFHRMNEDHKIFYLSTNYSSQHVQQYLADSRACLYFCKENTFQGLMLKGRMEICTDELNRKKLWKDSDIQYYHQGVNDDDYCVLRFIAEEGNYYHNLKNVSFRIKKVED